MLFSLSKQLFIILTCCTHQSHYFCIVGFSYFAVSFHSMIPGTMFLIIILFSLVNLNVLQFPTYFSLSFRAYQSPHSMTPLVVLFVFKLYHHGTQSFSQRTADFMYIMKCPEQVIYILGQKLSVVLFVFNVMKAFYLIVALIIILSWLFIQVFD